MLLLSLPTETPVKQESYPLLRSLLLRRQNEEPVIRDGADNILRAARSRSLRLRTPCSDGQVIQKEIPIPVKSPGEDYKH